MRLKGRVEAMERQLIASSGRQQIEIIFLCAARLDSVYGLYSDPLIAMVQTQNGWKNIERHESEFERDFVSRAESLKVRS